MDSSTDNSTPLKDGRGKFIGYLIRNYNDQGEMTESWITTPSGTRSTPMRESHRGGMIHPNKAHEVRQAAADLILEDNDE